VLLLSTGAEESFMEGMQGFARRHFDSLPRDRTHVICLDTVGSPKLTVLQGEGMLRMNEYPKDLIALICDCARELRIDIHDELRFRNATDGLIALKAGYPSAMLGSVDEYRVPANYHWPTDTAENVDYWTVADAARLCESLARRLADGGQDAQRSDTAAATASRSA
jgi:Zn-dependent M28 family amino/carboxypeptidase